MIGEYFNDYENRKIPFTKGLLDENGLPLFDPKTINLPYPKCYHPTTIIQYGLANFNKWKITNNNKYFKDFEKCCQWVINNGTKDNNNQFVWYIPFGIRTPLIKAPWISCITQGQGISLLLRFYNYSPTQDLKSKIDLIVNTFKNSIKEGGVTTYTSEGVFFQEAGNVFILNGNLSALVGLIEYCNFFEDKEVNKLINENIFYLESNLNKFDTGWWSKYSLKIRFNIADLHYMRTHIAQLTYLANKQNNSSFMKYAQKWDGYYNRKTNRIILKFYRFVFLNFSRVLTLINFNKLKYKN